MTTYPKDTDWVGKGWHQQPIGTKMTVHEDGNTFLYRDINERVHLLTVWPNGGVTITVHSPLIYKAVKHLKPHIGPVDPRLLKLANSWLEYLDAAVEKE